MEEVGRFIDFAFSLIVVYVALMLAIISTLYIPPLTKAFNVITSAYRRQLVEEQQEYTDTKIEEVNKDLKNVKQDVKKLTENVIRLEERMKYHEKRV